jgi:hypothetical protein
LIHGANLSNSAMQNAPISFSPHAPTPKSFTASTNHGTPSWWAMGAFVPAMPRINSFATNAGLIASES